MGAETWALRCRRQPCSRSDGNGACDMGLPAAFASPCNFDEDDGAGGGAVRRCVKKWGRAFNYICRAAGSKAVSTEYMYSATVETD